MQELIVDLFAGGGGASAGIAAALGRDPDLAVNHDADAVALHEVNHPGTLHLQRNVWHVDPLDHARNRPVGLLWASPDCKHFSKAKGGRPVKRNIRDLAWVVVLWAKRARPRVIALENVEEFRDWGPVGPDGRPCPERRGSTFDLWVRELKRLGYRVEWRELRACDYGAPTIRKRLFVIARRDGLPIRWPEPTHGDPKSAPVLAGALKPWRVAAEILDFFLPCPSIFLTPEEAKVVGCKRPLAPATMARIARGVKRYVLDAAEPFLIPVTHPGDARVHGAGEPIRTVTAANRGEQALVAPYFVPRYGEREGQDPRTRPADEPVATIVPTANQGALVAPHLMTMRNAQKPYQGADQPTHTITAGGAHMHLVAAFLAQHNGGVVGHDAREPLSTLTQRGTQQQVVEASFLSYAYTSNTRGGNGDLERPAKTVLAGGTHAAEVRAFLMKYYGTGGGSGVDEPAHAVTTRDRFAVVQIHGVDFVIVDIGMRMLTPRELFRAQGFPDSYVIDRRPDGSALTKTAQIKMCGNSVPPPLAEAIVAANCADMAAGAAAGAAVA